MTKQIRVIFGEHLCGDNEFMWAVPDYISEIVCGDYVIVETRFGKRIIKATSEIQICTDLIAQKFGASLPLKNVLFVLDRETVELIINTPLKFHDMPF